MSGLVAVNPKPFLSGLINKKAMIRLKWGNMRYKGTLISFDEYMNLLLSDCEEWIDEDKKGVLGRVFIRCNNVLYISSCENLEDSKADIQKTEEMKD